MRCGKWIAYGYLTKRELEKTVHNIESAIYWSDHEKNN